MMMAKLCGRISQVFGRSKFCSTDSPSSRDSPAEGSEALRPAPPQAWGIIVPDDPLTDSERRGTGCFAVD